MKCIIYLFPLWLVVLVGCTSNINKIPDVRGSAKRVNADKRNNIRLIELRDVEDYFFVGKVDDSKVFLLNEADFERYFQPAKTMTNRPTEVDFDMERMGAIVLPETKNNTNILLDSAYLSGRKLNIVYSINQESVKRSFSIVPSKVFTFEASLDVDSVVFRNGNDIYKFSMR
ncbi:hypothetical protein JGH11_16760 [Dysgonomonas sp. Marseille-P4677]|uniref:hypothetical protein n=1 Tax=Dysgonomonas sp. Marseille-P4677 TaxID=2364790 RepID=UPI0019125D49|nr:hypothetical protein [Dysgonomonas sp. Marseille-P4677]MBK5722527.1 hypothetical protein [Dysgonomonas sp. Marseille-P4677]